MTGTQGLGPMYPTIPHIYMDECSGRGCFGGSPPSTMERAKVMVQDGLVCGPGGEEPVHYLFDRSTSKRQ